MLGNLHYVLQLVWLSVLCPPLTLKQTRELKIILVAAARCGYKMVLRPTAATTHGFTTVSFTEPLSHCNTFVGGKCAPPSALLVL